MEEIVMQIIAKIQQNKVECDVVPTHVLYYKDLLLKVREGVLVAIENLVSSGKLTMVNTINDTAYDLGD